MHDTTRRKFLLQGAGLAAGVGLTLAGCATPGGGKRPAAQGARVVVVGGGFGGATAARYLKRFGPEIEVTLVEYNEKYYTCPGSNWVLGGLRDMESLAMSYDGLRRSGVRVVHDWVSAIDVDGRNIRLASGGRLPYDRLVVSPGIDFRWDQVEGIGEQDSSRIPHAWQAGPQTALLRNQIMSMRPGGTFVIVPPPNPFRCPPGPYERVSMVAHYFKQHNPAAKIVILDPKPGFSQQGLFTAGWKKRYGFGTDDSMIEWIGGDDGRVRRIDVATRTVHHGPLGEAIEADVLNFIPAQKTAALAAAAGLTDASGWCPVHQATWESARVPGVHVIGDSAIQQPLPKSGFAANSEAKMCAAAVVGLLRGEDSGPPSFINTCYSLVAPDYGISVAMVYKLQDGKVVKVKGAGGLTPPRVDVSQEAAYAQSWWQDITSDVWG